MEALHSGICYYMMSSSHDPNEVDDVTYTVTDDKGY